MSTRQRDTWGASLYEGMQHNPNHAYVIASYAAFKQVVMQQWHELREGGIQFIASSEDPYKNSVEMMRDVRENQTLRVWANGADHMPNDHPMKERVASEVEGFETLNDVFRAVHDIMGHVVSGGNFGPDGENKAWLAHRATMPLIAHNALWCETKGQNVWTNNAFDHPQMKLRDRPFPAQKSGLVPMFITESKPA